MTRPLVSPRLMTALSNHFPSRCTIMLQGYASGGNAGTVGHDSAGFKIKGAGSVASTGSGPAAVLLENIGCLNAVLSEDEQVEYGNMQAATHKCLLQGYYPTITDAMTAVIDGVAWNILGVEQSSFDMFTSLIVNRRAA